MAAPNQLSKAADAESQHRRSVIILRVVLAMCIVPLLVYMCLQSDHARIKGQPMNPWWLIPIIFTAATAATIGKRFLNSISGLFLGGIGGAFGADPSAGPYGGVVGLLVGAIVVMLPLLQKPKMKDGRKEVDGKASSPFHQAVGDKS